MCDGLKQSKTTLKKLLFFCKIVPANRLSANPELIGLSSMELFDKTVQVLTETAHLMVILNNHVRSCLFSARDYNTILLAKACWFLCLLGRPMVFDHLRINKTFLMPKHFSQQQYGWLESPSHVTWVHLIYNHLQLES